MQEKDKSGIAGPGGQTSQPDSPEPNSADDNGRAMGKARAAERLAASLRDNLRRRKAAAKARPSAAAPEPARAEKPPGGD